MKTWLRRRIAAIEWLTGLAVVVVGVVVWWQVRVAAGQPLTIYDLFPVFGLIAYGLMWTHFIFGALRRYADIEKPAVYRYGTISSGVVLAMILLHPGLLWYALWRDGFGLPPGSYLTVYDTQLVAIFCGSLGLGIFLAYEFKRAFGKKRWWRYIEYLQIVGMIAIFYHALQLGGELAVDWFRVIWCGYFLTLLVAICYTYYRKRRDKRNEKA